MSGTALILAAVVIITVWGGCSAWEEYLYHQISLRKIEAEQVRAKQETERLKILAEAIKGRQTKPLGGIYGTED